MFCREYLVDLNATQAAIRAGYSAKRANAIGYENLTKPDIAARVSLLQGKRAEKVEITADYVLSTIKETIERCKQGEPVRDKEGNETGEWKFEPNSVLKGAELLGKHLAMFTDKIAVQNPDGSAMNTQPIVHVNLIPPGDGNINRKPTE